MEGIGIGMVLVLGDHDGGEDRTEETAQYEQDWYVSSMAHPIFCCSRTHYTPSLNRHRLVHSTVYDNAKATTGSTPLLIIKGFKYLLLISNPSHLWILDLNIYCRCHRGGQMGDTCRVHVRPEGEGRTHSAVTW
jgi:hypothetical protein